MKIHKQITIGIDPVDIHSICMGYSLLVEYYEKYSKNCAKKLPVTLSSDEWKYLESRLNKEMATYLHFLKISFDMKTRIEFIKMYLNGVPVVYNDACVIWEALNLASRYYHLLSHIETCLSSAVHAVYCLTREKESVPATFLNASV